MPACVRVCVYSKCIYAHMNIIYYVYLQEIIQSLAETEELFSWMPGLNPPITLSQSEVVDNSHSVDTLSFVLPPPTKQDGLHQLLKIAVSAVKKGSFGYLDLAGPQRESPKVINIRRYVHMYVYTHV